MQIRWARRAKFEGARGGRWRNGPGLAWRCTACAALHCTALQLEGSVPMKRGTQGTLSPPPSSLSKTSAGFSFHWGSCHWPSRHEFSRAPENRDNRNRKPANGWVSRTVCLVRSTCDALSAARAVIFVSGKTRPSHCPQGRRPARSGRCPRRYCAPHSLLVLLGAAGKIGQRVKDDHEALEAHPNRHLRLVDSLEKASTERQRTPTCRLALAAPLPALVNPCQPLTTLGEPCDSPVPLLQQPLLGHQDRRSVTQ